MQPAPPEHVSEPLVAPLSEVSTGSGHEADDEAEEDKEENTQVSKIRNAINELQKEQQPQAETHALKQVDSETIESKVKKLSKERDSRDSNEDSYSFSYSDTFSTDESDEKIEDEEKPQEVQEPTPVLVDENKETISCRILTSDNNSVLFHPSKAIAEVKKQEASKLTPESKSSKDSLKKDLASTTQGLKGLVLPGTQTTVNFMQNTSGTKSSKEAIQEWAKEVRNK